MLGLARVYFGKRSSNRSPSYSRGGIQAQDVDGEVLASVS